MKEFFATVRSMFGGSLSQSQVDGIEDLLDQMDGLSVPLKAYLLATTFHETAGTMRPIHERGSRAYFDKYDAGTRLGRILGNTRKGDGYTYRGRGYVQITGRANYAKASERFRVDFLSNPDRAIEPRWAAQILIAGSIEGWFTGRRLDHYINDKSKDYLNARRVINGMDRARQIADYAVLFERALSRVPVPPTPYSWLHRIVMWLFERLPSLR